MAFEAGHLLAFLTGHLFSYPDSQSHTQKLILLLDISLLICACVCAKYRGEIHALEHMFGHAPHPTAEIAIALLISNEKTRTALNDHHDLYRQCRQRHIDDKRNQSLGKRAAHPVGS